MASIVTVNVSTISAPAPLTLQQTGAFISQGATTAALNSRTLLTTLADLTAILKGALANTSLTWSGSVVTVTTAAPHGFTTSDTIQMTIAGVTPAAYNGNFLATITGASTFTYPLVSNPGSETVPGTYSAEDVSELLAMGTTFFAQGSQQSVYVIELGAGSAAEGVTALTTYIGNNPNTFYSYLVPRTWAAESTFLTLLASFEATTSKTYFHITATTGNYTNFTALMKCAIVMVEAPSIPALEFSAAASFYVTMHYAPAGTNKVPPSRFAFLFGVTPYPLPGNGALLTTLATANVNVVGTGAEGGLTNTIWNYGTTKDGKDFTYWYSVDWVQLNIDLAISNAVINGSNNTANPLYYNQDGINRLQAVAAQTIASGVSFGLILGAPVQTALDPNTFNANVANGLYANQTPINAFPFIPYSAANPNDYGIGRYAGFTIVYVPARGFATITFQVIVSTFVIS